jgi:hypothetical protein
MISKKKKRKKSDKLYKLRRESTYLEQPHKEIYKFSYGHTKVGPRFMYKNSRQYACLK